MADTKYAYLMEVINYFDYLHNNADYYGRVKSYYSIGLLSKHGKDKL